jgi:hypothetical protein
VRGLPTWIINQQRRVETLKRQAQAEAMTVNIPLRDSPHTARGWREIDIEYSCVPDAANPWDPRVVRAIWAFFPNIVPMWVRWIFLGPNATEPTVFGRHALGLVIKDKAREFVSFKCDMPPMPCQGLTFERPTAIKKILMGEPPSDALDLPGIYQPFDMTVCHDLVYREVTLSPKEAKKRFRDDVLEGRARRHEQNVREDLRRREELDRFVERKLANMGESEMESEFGFASKPRKKRALVFLGSGPNGIVVGR